MNLGWECPRCHRIFSPVVLECSACNSAGHLKPDYGRIPFDPFSVPRAPTSGDPLPPLPSVVCGGITGSVADVLSVGRNAH